MIFVSTSCLKIGKNEERDLFRVLETYRKLGIKNIELGSMHPEIRDFSPLFRFKKKVDVNFIVHGFFPPAKNPFFINLASQNNERLRASMDFVRNSIDFCRKIDAKIYSMHGGYLFDWSENFPKGSRTILPGVFDHDSAFEGLMKNVQVVADYASENGIKIAIENCGVVEYKGKVMSLLHDKEEFKTLFKHVRNKNLGLLIDTGHLRKSSNRLGFSYSGFIKAMQNKVFELHVHQNNGKEDQHLPLKDASWLKDFDKSALKKAAVTIEAMNMEGDEIMNNLEFIDKIIKKK